MKRVSQSPTGACALLAGQGNGCASRLALAEKHSLKQTARDRLNADGRKQAANRLPVLSRAAAPQTVSFCCVAFRPEWSWNCARPGKWAGGTDNLHCPAGPFSRG